MLDELNTLSTVDTVLRKLEEVNTLYLTKVGEQIKAIGEMNATSLDRLTVMTETGANITEITAALASAMRVTEADVMKIYQKALDDVYDSPRFRKALEYKSLTPADFQRINTFAEAVSRQTLGRLENFSNTTAVAEDYRRAVDRSILAVSSGLTSYSEATRDIIRDVGSGGVKVIYESGYRRRLDSAVRQNIIDGANQISGHCADMIGEALGYDAIELTAHLNSAPDHEPVQGRVFLRSEFEKMQNGEDMRDVDGNRYKGFRRPINEWNCGHFAMPFSTEFSGRAYSNEDLERFRQQNHNLVEIDGKKYTKYQCSQIMRRLETESRRQKDIAVVAAAAGNMDERRLRQVKINALSEKYRQVAEASGLRGRRGRMVVRGFRAVKVLKPVEKYTSYQYNKDGTIIVTDDWKSRAKPSIPKEYKPFAVIETKSEYKNGTVQIDRSLFDSAGKLNKQIHSGPHNRPDLHPYGKQGEHHHIYQWNEDGNRKSRITDEITDQERVEHADILP